MSLDDKHLLIRTDANAGMGMGHAMRCLALAQAWQDAGGQATFAMADNIISLAERLCTEGFRHIQLSTLAGSADDVHQIIALARRKETSIVVVDGYHFGTDYQKAIKNAGLDLLFIDDYGHAETYWADFVLNQNIYAHEKLYLDQAPYSKLLLGTRYTLLRREFLKWQEWEREIPDVGHKVLVTLGGGDPDNVTLKVIQALQQVQIDDLEIVVVVGGSNPHKNILDAAVQRSSASIDLKSNVMDMSALMAWADVAVSAGGSTTWEIAFMGLPSLVLILTENQRPVAEGLDKADVAVNLGWHVKMSSAEISQALTCLLMKRERRAGMTQRGRALVDGQGCTRALEHVRYTKCSR
jgi:UDP-2,4-diacetamido-2,4,6-trideoxy-beta-L-altropyranose hydrolase